MGKVDDAITIIRDEIAELALKRGEAFNRVVKVVCELEEIGLVAAVIEDSWSTGEAESVKVIVKRGRAGGYYGFDFRDVYCFSPDELNRRREWYDGSGIYNVEGHRCSPSEFAGALARAVRQALADQRRRTTTVVATAEAVVGTLSPARGWGGESRPKT